jgi:hypothetical protein
MLASVTWRQPSEFGIVCQDMTVNVGQSRIGAT